MPIDQRRRDEIAAAVAAYDRDHPDAPLPRNAARLLAVMFPSEDVCQRSLEAIAAEGFNRRPASCDATAPGRGRVPVPAPGSALCPTPTASTCRRCGHEEPPPREGVRPRPRRAAGPQRQGPHRRLQPRLGPPTPPAGAAGAAPSGRASLDVLGALLWGFHNARSGCCFPSYETIAGKAGCARSTVAEAIKALEWAGVLTWQNRIMRIRERCRDLFGRVGWRWRVIRTSNAYVLIDPASKSDQRTGTPDQENSKPLQAPAVDPNSPLERALDPIRRDDRSKGGSNVAIRVARKAHRTTE